MASMESHELLGNKGHAQEAFDVAYQEEAAYPKVYALSELLAGFSTSWNPKSKLSPTGTEARLIHLVSKGERYHSSSARPRPGLSCCNIAISLIASGRPRHSLQEMSSASIPAFKHPNGSRQQHDHTRALSLYCALLATEIYIGKPVPLRVTICPFEVIHRTPAWYARTLAPSNGARQLRQNLAVKGDTARVGNMASFVGTVKIATAILADLNDGVVIFARDLHYEVIDTSWPYL